MLAGVEGRRYQYRIGFGKYDDILPLLAHQNAAAFQQRVSRALHDERDIDSGVSRRQPHFISALLRAPLHRRTMKRTTTAPLSSHDAAADRVSRASSAPRHADHWPTYCRPNDRIYRPPPKVQGHTAFVAVTNYSLIILAMPLLAINTFSRHAATPRWLSCLNTNSAEHVLLSKMVEAGCLESERGVGLGIVASPGRRA